MNINCLICTDIFTPSSDIYSTPCGHIFHYHCLLHWLENSKTCPQCRTKTNIQSLVRLYLNVANSQGIEDNVTVLQHKLDGLEYQLRLKNTDIKNFSDKFKTQEEQNKALRLKVKELEMTEMRHESVMAALKDQIKFFKQKSQSCDTLMVEVSRLKGELKNLENVQAALSGSRKEVEDIIRNENSVESLALLAATLKKSLVDTDRKKRELHHEVKKLQNALSFHKRSYAQTNCEYQEVKRELESLKESYQKEVTFLKSKFAKLQSKAILNESANDSIRRITLESPVNFHRTPEISTKKSNIVDLTESPSTSQQRLTSDKISNIEKEIVEIDSPLPASSLGVLAIQRAKLINNPDQNKFSIFKNKHVPQFETIQLKPLRRTISEVAYDGFGGSSKEDIFPVPEKSSTGVKRSKTSKTTSNKFKKLSAEAGKSKKKVTDFFSID